QQPVVEAAVPAALVLPHDADGPEADLLVAADRARVVRGGVDDQPVVAAVLEEVAREQPDRLRSEAAVLEAARQVDVDAGVKVVGIRLLVPLDAAGDLA